MDLIDDGGPAFPFPTTSETITSGPWAAAPGMSLRDWFAAKATEEDLAEFRSPDITIGEVLEFEKEYGFRPTRQWARYQYADAMIRERRLSRKNDRGEPKN